jgi:hypothetical protein
VASGTAGRVRRPTADRTVLPMRAMFVLYVVVISSGIAYFTVIGLTHH